MSVERAREARQARRAYLWVAAGALALTFAVVIASAYLRHRQAGLSCEPWPACYARIDAVSAVTEPDAAVRAARTVHRLSATAVTAAILGLLLLTWTQRPVWRREALVSTAALAVVGALAVLGIVTPGAKSPAVVLGNLIGGYLLLALLAIAWSLALQSPSTGWRIRSLASAALASAFAVAALGGLIGAHYASRSCPTLLDCGTAGPDARAIAAIAFFGAPATADGRFVAPDWAATLHVMHRTAAIALIALSAVVVHRLRRERPRVALALSVAITMAAVLGMTSVSMHPALAIVVLHNAAAASVIGVLAVASVNPSEPSQDRASLLGTTIA